MVGFRQVGCEGSGQVLRVRSAAMDPDAVSTPHRFSGDERLRANPRPGVMKSWGCPWFPFVLELLREAAAKSPSPITNFGVALFWRPEGAETGKKAQGHALGILVDRRETTSPRQIPPVRGRLGSGGEAV